MDCVLSAQTARPTFLCWSFVPQSNIDKMRRTRRLSLSWTAYWRKRPGLRLYLNSARTVDLISVPSPQFATQRQVLLDGMKETCVKISPCDTKDCTSAITILAFWTFLGCEWLILIEN
jgi:hypothetical protein